MSVLSDKLQKVDLSLKSFPPYYPGADRIRMDIVVQVGSYWSVHVPLGVYADKYKAFQVEPPRRDSVRIYFLGTERLAKSEFRSFYSVDWPFHWKRNGNGWSLFFPARAKLPWLPVEAIPHDHAKPVGIGPRVVLPHRDASAHIRKSRESASRKLRQIKDRVMHPFIKFPQFTRTNPETIYWSGFNGHDDYYTAWTEFPVQTLRYYRGFTSVNTPGYRSMKRGKLPVNPYSLSLIKVEDPMAHDLRSCSYPPWNSRAYAPASNWTQVPAAPVHAVQAHDQAVSNLISRAEFGMGGNLAQDLAQVGQLTNMIGDSAHRLASSIRHVKGHRFKDAWRVLSTPSVRSRGLGYRVTPKGSEPQPWKSVAENWLALQYGWKPLLMDIHEALRSLANAQIYSPNVVRTARGTGKWKTHTVTELGTTSQWYQKTGYRMVTTYTNCTIGMRYSIDSNFVQFLAQTGFTNPINLLWEVLPYSFVVDWFIPIGPYLETLSAFDGLSLVDGFETNITKQYTLSVHDYNGQYPAYASPPNPKTTWDFKSRYWREYIQVNRMKLYSFPSLTRPHFKNPLTVTHALNGLALLRAAFA